MHQLVDSWRVSSHSSNASAQPSRSLHQCAAPARVVRVIHAVPMAASSLPACQLSAELHAHASFLFCGRNTASQHFRNSLSGLARVNIHRSARCGRCACCKRSVATESRQLQESHLPSRFLIDLTPLAVTQCCEIARTVSKLRDASQFVDRKT